MITNKVRAEITYNKNFYNEIRLKTTDDLTICNIYFDEMKIKYNKSYNTYYISLFEYYDRDLNLKSLMSHIEVDNYEIL